MKRETKPQEDTKKTKKTKGKAKGGRKTARKTSRKSKSNNVESDKEFEPSDDEIVENEDVKPEPVEKPSLEMPPSPKFDIKASEYAVDMEKDILDIEAPTFTTLSRVGSAALQECSWNVKAEMIGGKVTCPMIHCCECCNKPILIYGRVIPCKHVFCLNCAVKDKNRCQHCGADVERIDNVRLGSVYMCTEGGRRYGKDGCRRTYMSPRDLQAHITHRHSAQTLASKMVRSQASVVSNAPARPTSSISAASSSTSSSLPKTPLSVEVHSVSLSQSQLLSIQQLQQRHLAQQQQNHHAQQVQQALQNRPSVSPRQSNSSANMVNAVNAVNMNLNMNNSRRLLSPAGGSSVGRFVQVQHSPQQGLHLPMGVNTSVPPPSAGVLGGTKVVRPPKVSPGGLSLSLSGNPLSVLGSDGGVSVTVSSTGMDQPHFNPTAPPPPIIPPQPSSIPVLSSTRRSSAASTLIPVPIQDVVSSTDNNTNSNNTAALNFQGLNLGVGVGVAPPPPRPLHSHPPPPINVAGFAASNFFATTAPPPLPVAVAVVPPPPVVAAPPPAPVPAPESPSLSQINLSVPPPNFLPRNRTNWALY